MKAILFLLFLSLGSFAIVEDDPIKTVFNWKFWKKDNKELNSCFSKGDPCYSELRDKADEYNCCITGCFHVGGSLSQCQRACEECKP